MPSEEHAEVERPPFDLNLAVVLAGFAFESYNTPPAKVGVHEVDAFDCETVFLSQHFLREFYDGQLFIQLKRGSQFPGLDLWGTSDPYVTLRTGDCVVRSRTIWATTEPVWDESFAINMKNPSSQYLQIAAWDANIVAYDRRLGNASVALEPLSDGKKHEVCVELEGMGGGGVLYLEVQYKTFSQIDEEKKGWKIPLLSDFFMGEGLENFLMDAFGSEGIKARDFVWSAIGNLQLSLDDGKAETQNSHGCSQTMESRSTISEETLESNDGRTRTKKEGDFKVEVGQNGKESRIPKVEITPLPEKDTKERSSVGALETDKQISETELEESLERQVDFLRILGKGVDSILGAGTVESLKIPSIDHVSWDAIDMIKRLGLESQTRADIDYVENGLALPKAQQDIYPTPESSPGLRSVPSTEELKKVSVDVLKQMEEVLGSWAVVAASVTGKGKEIKQGMGEDMKGKTVAIVKEQQPESFKNWEDEFTRKTVETTTANSDEMEELRKMFETAESAMEAWAMLATSLGRTSFVKSEFEKICFLDNNKTDTQVAIWRDDRQHRLVVAFRGTEQVKWKDLRTDLMLLPTGFNPERVGGDFKEEVMVHSGFLSAYDSVRSRLLSFVKTSVGFSESEQETRPKWHIYVTGHSLGGALATLFALELSSTKLSKCGDVKVTMYNFGSPRVGNKRFAEQYNEKVKDSWRVVNHRDIIPTVPRLMGYCHVAQPIYLAAGDIMSATVNMELLEDGYEGDVIGEATPDFLLEEFMKGEKKLIDRLLQTEIAMLRALRDGSALMQHMEDFYYIALLERVSPMLRLTESDPKQE